MNRHLLRDQLAFGNEASLQVETSKPPRPSNQQAMDIPNQINKPTATSEGSLQRSSSMASEARRIHSTSNRSCRGRVLSIEVTSK